MLVKVSVTAIGGVSVAVGTTLVGGRVGGASTVGVHVGGRKIGVRRTPVGLAGGWNGCVPIPDIWLGSMIGVAGVSPRGGNVRDGEGVSVGRGVCVRELVAVGVSDLSRAAVCVAARAAKTAKVGAPRKNIGMFPPGSVDSAMARVLVTVEVMLGGACVSVGAGVVAVGVSLGVCVDVGMVVSVSVGSMISVGITTVRSGAHATSAVAANKTAGTNIRQRAY